MPVIDQFTRWKCVKCHQSGFDSWNKAAHDGPGFGENIPARFAFGDACQECGWDAAICYTAPDTAPTIIYAPTPDDFGQTLADMEALEDDPAAGLIMEPGWQRDRDWSGGCVPCA